MISCQNFCKHGTEQKYKFANQRNIVDKEECKCEVAEAEQHKTFLMKLENQQKENCQ